ncbi:NAD(P)/FAD-dependent oxidoreductase [Leekyejoonella antrihumi]|uniref:FAD-binding oxidoreductase n=1 Tax=Leekyejoonella antrihumi TaxID=1660198 RepID=A0A563E7T6_9MICO|nr:FAD-binding oxidoreductase [Leekyejoonella antrihumi]TWP38577.1 FAD-binding oxidoreductase [Leekyejoonella antrihumi]
MTEITERSSCPTRASAVIIGGGVMGVSAAFHLAEAGVQDVVLVERNELGSGSTCKAAGCVRAQFSDRTNIELGLRSLRAFESFGSRPGQAIDLHQPGYLFLLDSPESVAVFEQSVELQQSLGVPSRMLSPAEAKELSPLISTDGLHGAAFSPTDGYCAPESVVLGYATAARRLGARLLTGCAALGIETTGGQVTAVHTADGTIKTDTVICAAGAWSREVGGWAGVDLPVTPLRRQILISKALLDLPADLPMTVDFATSFYFHREGEGLLIGMSDPDEAPGFSERPTDDWLPRLGDAIGHRTPALLDVGFGTGWAGLYEMTPDHNALIGSAPHTDRFLYATGFSGHGFLMGPAVGEVLRDLYLGRTPVVDVSALDAGRFVDRQTRPELNIV